MMRLLLVAVSLVLVTTSGSAQEPDLPAAIRSEAASVVLAPRGDPERGRLLFGRCRTCHFTAAGTGHSNGPNLHRIFGKVAGKQAGFDYYSPEFKAAQFVWTPGVLYVWLANPMAAMPDTTMMSTGVPDPQERADLIAYLEFATVRTFPD
jgi:cytochrome c